MPAARDLNTAGRPSLLGQRLAKEQKIPHRQRSCPRGSPQVATLANVVVRTTGPVATATMAALLVIAGPTSAQRWQALPELHRAVERYAALDRQGWPALPSVARSVRPGDLYGGTEALRQRLIALGDAAADPAGEDQTRLTPELADALKQFQLRHGLEVDGVLGTQTLAELNVPLSQRILQLEHAIKVIEGSAPTDSGRSIVVAVPFFRLWAWNGAPWREPPAVDARVIVGNPRTPTPELISTIQSVTFRPYWTVPVSIAAGEIVPAIRADAQYLTRHRFEIVRPSGEVVAYSPNLLPRLSSGELQLRQRPGPSNALGLVRFDFPNEHRVFLHDTPSRQLFARQARALSHGCIRLEDPARLAVWVLNAPSWDAESVGAAFEGSDNHRVPVTDPVRIQVIYITAIVMPDGLVHFSRDIYRRLKIGSTADAPGGQTLLPQC